MDATKGNIYAILNGNKQFLIPVYQRYYGIIVQQPVAQFAGGSLGIREGIWEKIKKGLFFR